MREDGEHDPGKEKQTLKNHLKWSGKTGLIMFGRRIQGLWEDFSLCAGPR